MKTIQIRKSQYNDYFAVDYLDEQGKMVETPIYLKPNQQAKIRMRWDCLEHFDSNQSWMEDAFIRFNGNTIEVAYATPSLGQKEITWWEPSMHELTSPTFMHYKAFSNEKAQ